MNATTTWQINPKNADPTANITVTGYAVQWMLNGAPAALVIVPASNAQDTSGYSADFDTGNPTVTLKAQDVVGVTVAADDAVHGLRSTPQASTPATIVIQPPPPTPGTPLPPLNVALAQT